MRTIISRIVIHPTPLLGRNVCTSVIFLYCVKFLYLTFQTNILSYDTGLASMPQTGCFWNLRCSLSNTNAALAAIFILEIGNWSFSGYELLKKFSFINIRAFHMARNSLVKNKKSNELRKRMKYDVHLRNCNCLFHSGTLVLSEDVFNPWSRYIPAFDSLLVNSCDLPLNFVWNWSIYIAICIMNSVLQFCE